MTTEVKVEYVNGNKAIRVAVEGEVRGTLEKPGDAVNVLVHSDQHVSVGEHGDFRPTPSTLGGEPGSNVPDERIED